MLYFHVINCHIEQVDLFRIYLVRVFFSLYVIIFLM